jgi:hypothetical protein
MRSSFFVASTTLTDHVAAVEATVRLVFLAVKETILQDALTDSEIL